MKKRHIILVIAVVIIIMGLFASRKKDFKNVNDNTDNNSISKIQHNHMKINAKKYYSVDSYIMYLPSIGMYRNHVELKKQNEIQSVVQFFNELNVIPLEETYEYEGGDSPAAWSYLYHDHNNDLADEIRFYEDLDHTMIVRECVDSEYKYYKIDTEEYEKLKKFFESYDD